MTTQLEPIAALLKAARERKGLSQRALGRRVGLPQSHISKIENAAVNLQTSSLIEIARALDLELTLLPRSALPAIRALQDRSSSEVTPLADAMIDERLLSLISQTRKVARSYPNLKVF